MRPLPTCRHLVCKRPFSNLVEQAFALAVLKTSSEIVLRVLEPILIKDLHESFVHGVDDSGNIVEGLSCEGLLFCKMSPFFLTNRDLNQLEPLLMQVVIQDASGLVKEWDVLMQLFVEVLTSLMGYWRGQGLLNLVNLGLKAPEQLIARVLVLLRVPTRREHLELFRLGFLHDLLPSFF